MKWKLTGRFLMAIMSIVFIVILANSAIFIGLYVYQHTSANLPVAGEDFTRSMERYITKKDGVPEVSEEGIVALEEQHAWLQFLDESGHVTGSVLTPKNAKQHYTPLELIHAYKYKDRDFTTVFVANKEDIIYLVGIQDRNLSKVVLTMNTGTVAQFISQFALVIIIVDICIAGLVGLIFGSVLTRPIYLMIERIQKLKNRDFSVTNFGKTGLYKSVFSNLDNVAESLKTQEVERMKLEKMRDEWISNVSHDMKTPLASIQGYAELLQDQVSDEERAGYARVIERKSIYMRELLDDLNLTMRLRKQKMPLQLVHTNMTSFIRELVIDVLNDPLFDSYAISFISDADKLTRPIDQHLLKRALLNFMYNALIHNEKDVRLLVSLEEVAGIAIVKIEDNGKGIAEEDIPQVFERYYRGTNTENVKGTGLGLAIARDIITAHGGKVVLTSKVGSGTTVTVEL